MNGTGGKWHELDYASSTVTCEVAYCDHKAIWRYAFGTMNYSNTFFCNDHVFEQGEAVQLRDPARGGAFRDPSGMTGSHPSYMHDAIVRAVAYRNLITGV